MDERIRRLERAAVLGDPQAAYQLFIEGVRIQSRDQFSYLGMGTWSCGGQTYTLACFRHDSFAKALGLACGERDPACEFVLVPGGSFYQGSHEHENGHFWNEMPRHLVHVKPFLVARTPVTQAIWESVMGYNRSRYFGSRRPVECVSWDDCQEFCQKTGLRLPSESEWEYACRSGAETQFTFGDRVTPDQANLLFDSIISRGTTNVGNYLPNAFGLYDVHGNVYEWCQDSWHHNYIGAPTDGSAWIEPNSDRRVMRGGCWECNAELHRGSASRNSYWTTSRVYLVGFRPVCDVHSSGGARG